MLPERDIWLPDIRIAGIKPVASSMGGKDQPPSVKAKANDSPQQNHRAFSSPFPNMCRKADERLAEDRIGEELAPDATIWELYQEESKEFDNELIDGRNKNLDMMLLFAGLFSAVVTGFLVESKSMLLQNPSDVSVELLLHIAQSQQRLEAGIPQPASPRIEIPPFEAPTCARLVNGFWFSSLSLALFAALLAMLAKEWLTAFGASRPRSPYAHTLLHQRRLKGLSQWYALHIIDFLPTVLHFALLLFSVGLVIYLWTIDYTIAMTIVAIVGVAVLFYVVTAILASIYPFCPFVTQVSKYIGSAFIHSQTLSKLTHITSKSQASVTSLELLQALKWLTEHARDQLAADCSYQALAGLKIPRVAKDSNTSDHDSNATDRSLNHLKVAALTTSKSLFNISAEIFRTICSRIPQTLISESGQLSASQGISISRYANTLPHLVHLLGTNLSNLLTREGNETDDQSQTWMKKSPVQSAFAALDFVWNDDRPHYTVDTFVLLTAAELRLTEVAASYCQDQPDPLALPSPLPQVDTSASTISTKSWSVVDVLEVKAESVPLFDLRARFSRALFQAAVGLKYYADEDTRIRADALLYLLKSIRLCFLCPNLNPRTRMSTHQPQNVRNKNLPIFRSSVAGTGTNMCLGPFNIGDQNGLLAGLMHIISSEATGEQPELARSAMHTLSVAAPILLRQWLTMNLDTNLSPAERTHISAALFDFQSFWPNSPSVDGDTAHVSERAMEQLLVIALTASSCSQHKGISQLPEQALRTLYQLTNGTFGPNYARIAAVKSSDLILRLIPMMWSEKKLDSQAPKFIIHWLLTSTENPRNTTVIQHVREHSMRTHQRDIYLEFLEIWAHIPGLDSELECLVEKILEGPMGDALNPLWSSSGLLILAKIALRTEYSAILARLIEHMVAVFLGADCTVHQWEDPSRKLALPNFLQAIGLALKTISSSSPGSLILSKAFSSAASTLRCDLQANLADKGPEPCKDTLEIICDVLLNKIAISPQRDVLLSYYNELLRAAEDPEAWWYGALSWLFQEDNMPPEDVISGLSGELDL